MNKEIVQGFAWGGSMLALALAASTLRRLGYVDGEVVTRLVIGLNGLWVAWYGNRMPKRLVRSAVARRVQRLASWSMVLSGLVYMALFALAPLNVAFVAGSLAIVGGIAVTLGYCWSLRTPTKVA